MPMSGFFLLKRWRYDNEQQKEASFSWPVFVFSKYTQKMNTDMAHFGESTYI